MCHDVKTAHHGTSLPPTDPPPHCLLTPHFSLTPHFFYWPPEYHFSLTSKTTKRYVKLNDTTFTRPINNWLFSIPSHSINLLLLNVWSFKDFYTNSGLMWRILYIFVLRRIHFWFGLPSSNFQIKVVTWFSIKILSISSCWDD